MAAANPAGEKESGPLRLQFDRTVKLAFCGSSISSAALRSALRLFDQLCGSAISSDGGLLLHREPDDALDLTDLASGIIADPSVGKNGRHHLCGLLRQSIFSRLAGYEDVKGVSGTRAFRCPMRTAKPVGQRLSAIHGLCEGSQATYWLIGLVGAAMLVGKGSNGKDWLEVAPGYRRSINNPEYSRFEWRQ